MTGINPKLIHLPKHRRDKMVGAVMEDSLRKQYGRKNIRVIKGDSVRVMRGEYKGVEGKVEKVNTEQATFHIEGIQRDRKSTRLNSSHANISYAVFCLKKKNNDIYSLKQLIPTTNIHSMH